MEVTLDANAVSAALGALSGVLVTTGVAWTRVVRPIQRIAEDWRGEPARPEAGIPERPGMMLRMARLEAEMHPNHGSSLRDSVNRIESNLGAHIASHAVMLTAPPPVPPFTPADGTQQHRGTGVGSV